MKIQIFTFLGILYVLLQVWFFNISSLGWRLNASWVIITTILFTLLIIYANATINYYKYKGEKKMTPKEALARLEEENKKLKDIVSKNVVKVTKTNSGKVAIKTTPYADTRTIETDITEEMLMGDTLKHIEAVNNLLKHSALKLIEAGKVHDRTKIGEDFDAFFKIIKSGKTGEDFFKSRWYKKHIREERHHINSRVPKKVNLFDVLEMVADIVAAGLARTGKVYPINLTDKVLQDAVKNTVALLISESETVEK